ncbi:MAG: hypothetical protein SOV71_00895 [Anaerovoracaceae bacterium]|nr:hypothetical protein [Bacillota bacterium]MDY2670098.1 hypothetical protein [Anaerovoracaceae bacterium]
MRDFWNDVVVEDEEAVKKAVIDLINAAKPLSYSEIQELRNSSTLCDRSHFQYTVARIAARSGAEVPADLDAIMEDPDFDVRVSFMNDVVKAVDEQPIKPRVHR